MSDLRQQILDRVETLKGEAIDFFQNFTRIDTSNPPGNTEAGAAFIARFLDKHGLAHRVIAPQPTMPNILASTKFGGAGRHLVLNGHIDVFPAGDATRWSRDPWSGDIVDGAVFGRGTADMKCGTTASVFTYLLLHGMRDQLKGRLTLTAVSDEETGGRWGTGYLIEHHAEEVLGDCVLNGEPSSPWTVRFAEKSPIWFRFRVRTPGAHSAYPHVSASATKIAARLMLDLEALETLEPRPPESVTRILGTPEALAGIERGLGKGAMRSATRVTVNFGIIQGGVKVNMLPGDCMIEADIRMPVGIMTSEIRAAVNRILERYPEVTAEELIQPPCEPSCSTPDHEMLRLIQDNAERLSGYRPAPIVTLGGTDCRFWRQKGIPAYVYGCSPGRMSAPDESVTIDEFMHVLKTHALSAGQYLSIA